MNLLRAAAFFNASQVSSDINCIIRLSKRWWAEDHNTEANTVWMVTVLVFAVTCQLREDCILKLFNTLRPTHFNAYAYIGR